MKVGVLCLLNSVMLFFLAVIPTVCPDLPTPTNGESVGYNNMGTMNNRPVGAVATYSCADGYILMGNMTRDCGSDGEWSGPAPTCEGAGFMTELCYH